ncbi:hypothetical protein DF41_24790 [Raoultella planticola]|nr:hypothetical protein DF41_24790 [Raoultella planticola]
MGSISNRGRVMKTGNVMSNLSPDIQLELVKTACLLLQEEYRNQGSLNEAVAKKITTAISQMTNELFFDVSQVYP